MLSNADSSWQMTQSATLPRSMRSSLYLRRRIEGLGPKIQEGDSVRMSMPAEMCDFLDVAQGIDGSSSSGLVAEAAPDMGSHSSMLHALLSCLPEPPLTQPRCSAIDTLSALADELPQPPLSPTNSLPPLSPPTSPMPAKARSLAAMPSAAVARDTVAEMAVDRQRLDTAADIESPAAVSGLDALDALAALETPAPSRRNTDEVPLTQQQELRRLSDSPGLLDDEMPPESPLFAGVADQDIRRMRDSIRNAKLARSRSVGAARSTWCAPGHEPLFGKYALAPLFAFVADEDSLCIASLHATNKTPARASLAAVLDGWAEGERPAGEWLSSQQPPSSADELHAPATPGPAAAAALPTDPPAPRRFRVQVHSLFGSEAVHASVAELSDAASTASSQTAVEDDDADMQAALAQHPAALQSLKARCETHAKSRLRAPTRLSTQRLQPRFALPALEFVVSSSGRKAARDQAVQSVDVDAMVAAYLPHVYAKLYGTAEGTRERTESESSARTLADTHGGSDYAESHDSASSEDTLLQQRSVRMRPAQSLPEQRRKPTRLDGKLSTPRPRHAASVANLKAVEGSARHARRQLHSLAQLAAPATVASRRRSEVEALITQANAVLSIAPSGPARRRSANQPHCALAAPSGLRPPRASFPLSAARMPPQPQRAGSIVISPRNSIASPRGSVLSDSGISRIPSPASALSSLQIARQPLRSDSMRRRAHLSSGSSSEISPLALAPVHTAISSELAACRLPASAPIRRSRPSISLSGLRPPQPPASSGLRMPSTPALKRPPVSAVVPRGASSLVASSGSGGLAGARRLQGPSSVQHLPRLLGSSGSMMRSSTVGYSGMSYAYSSDSEESSMLADSSDTLARLRNPGARGSGRGGANRDDEFLTLRPVHTPDIVPRTIDPRLVERAMTPMLKLNASAKQPAPSSSLSQMVQQLSDDNCSSMASLPDAGNSNRVIIMEDSRPEPRTSTNTDQVSHMSPLNSPKQSFGARASTDSGRRFGRPGFLARRWTKHSTAPVPAVSAIPMPPPSTEKSPPKKSVSSKIPSLRKARSLWSLRPSLSK
ncbi:hypothetical protein IWW40_002067 [Coemansia sp. RSA 1250]|nr:hypothetical protein IWW40_002067 [Coemansia sp. RSA 1250]